MFTLTSPEIVERGVIPTRYANGAGGVECGENISPSFNWDGAPEGTRSFALTCVDPDVPLEEEWFPYKEQLKVGTLPGDLFIHWIVCDIPVSIKALVERASPYNMPSGAKELVTSFGTAGYGGPAPPKRHKAHAYIFTIYALGVEHLGLPKEAGYVDFINAMKGKILATASVTGYFSH